MTSFDLIKVSLTSAVCCALLLWPVRGILRKAGFIDVPNLRSSHKVNTVRGGGIAIVCVLIAATFMLWPSVRGICTGFQLPVLALALVSLCDDLYSVSPKTRIVVHAMVAAVALHFLFFRGAGLQRGNSWATALYLGLSFLWLVGFTNAFNFMDGVNGMAAFQATVTGMGIVILGNAAGVSFGHPAMLIGAVLSGAAAGFLPYNFPNATMFMGDVGSASIGFVLAFITIWLASGRAWWVALALCCLQANYLFDTVLTLLRRLIRREPIQEAHRDHFYQLLVRAGWSHARVTLVEMFLQVTVLIALVIAARVDKTAVVVACFSVMCLWLIFFAFAKCVFEKHKNGIA